MRLRDFFAPESIGLNLPVKTKPEALSAMVDLLGVEPTIGDTLRRLLEKR